MERIEEELFKLSDLDTASERILRTLNLDQGVPGYLQAKGITYPNFVVADDDFPKIFKGNALTVPLRAAMSKLHNCSICVGRTV